MTMIRRGGDCRVRKAAEQGFSLLEVVISMAVLTVGMVSLLGVFGLAMASTQTSQQDMIAKQLANEAYESIVTARNTTQITFDDIQNSGSTTCPITGASTCGIFANGLVPMCLAPTTGAYAGIMGTTSAVTGTTCVVSEQTLQDPGPDGVFQTADDTFIPLTGYQRSILIAPLYDAQGNLIASLRSTTITVQYSTAQSQTPKTYILNSLITRYE
jgi:prepilin-type N-terminal cleavage/methylation domain-containing protein